MTVHSGKYGIVDGKSTVRQWSIVEQEAQPKGVASNSRLGTFRRPGVRRWNGNYQAYGATPAVMPGEQFAFKGYTAPVNDIAGSTGMTYSGNAVVRSVAITWNWRNAAILSHQVNFEGHLALTKANNIPVPDASAIDSPSVIGCKFTWDKATPAALQDIINLTQGVLTISSEVQTYVNSHTVIGVGAGMVCWTGAVGGPIDWSLALSQEDDSRGLANDLLIGDLIQLKLYTIPGGANWDLQYGIVRDYSGITVNRETGSIIGRTINVDMVANNGSTLGHINRPDGTTWWPATPAGLLAADGSELTSQPIGGKV